MRKYIIALLLSVTISANAVLVTTTNLAATGCATLTTLTGGAVNVKYILLSSIGTTTNSSSCDIYDSATGGIAVTNIAYYTITRTLTNFWWMVTNYYGATNYYTNIALYTLTNTVAAATNTLAPVYSLSSLTNTSTEFDGLNYTFNRGVCISNSSLGRISVSVGYLQ